MKLVLFSLSLIFALAYLSSNFGNGRGPASIPVQNLAEIKAQKEKKPDFDHDLENLSRMEGHYSERGGSHRPAARPMQQAGRAASPAPMNKFEARQAQHSRIRAQAPRKRPLHPDPTRISRR